jgi:hypothetical protein
LQTQIGHRQALLAESRRFGQKRIGLALHFLQQKIELLADFATGGDGFFKLLDVAAQPRQFFGNVSAFRQ